MKVAVTGANGLIGGEAVALLAGHEVLALGKGSCRLPPGRYTWASADLGLRGQTAAALTDFRAEAVLHAGGLTDVDACERDPERAWRVNAEGTAEVARACRALGARLVALSTDYVFDGAAGPYGEDAVPNPLGAYARSKHGGEEAALLLAEDAVVARVAVVYGGRTPARSTFAAQVVEKLSRGEPVRAFHDQRVSTTLASAGAARLVELLLESHHRGFLHACDATVLDRVELARRIAVRFGLTPRIVPVATADAKLLAPRPLRGGLRVDLATSLLRNRPLELDEALDRVHAEWVERHPRASVP